MAEDAPGEPVETTRRSVTFAPVRRLTGGRYGFGAAGPDGRFIEGFAHPWCHPLAEPPPGPVARLDGTAAYGGLAMSHFGHVLLEALSRLWFLRAKPAAMVAGEGIR